MANNETRAGTLVLAADELLRDTWPALMVTRRAVAFTGQSRSTLERARKSGALIAVGRRGRAYVYAKEDLVRWLLGRDSMAVGAIVTTPIIPILSASKRTLEPSLVKLRRAEGRDPEAA